MKSGQVPDAVQNKIKQNMSGGGSLSGGVLGGGMLGGGNQQGGGILGGGNQQQGGLPNLSLQRGIIHSIFF